MTAQAYGYYCPVAHALGIVGDKWSLLIIRDLLRKPQRFTDLLGYLGNITPKLLMLRLRKLEEAGVVKREKGQDKREAWYTLTEAGIELRAVVEGLKGWGMKHAMRPPLPGEVVYPEFAIGTLAGSLNQRGRRLPRPVAWLFAFTPGEPYVLYFDGERWSARQGDDETPDVTIWTSPETWISMLSAKRDARREFLETMKVNGIPERVDEFLRLVGVRDANSREDAV